MEVAAGIYKSVIFPGGLANTESHLSDLQKAMLDATPDCIKVISVDGKLLAMNRAGCVALNVPEGSEFGMPWLPLLPQAVHALGHEALRKAAAGQNARFPGRSESAAGTRYWDNLLTPVVDGAGQVQSILCVSRDVTAKTLLERDLEEAIKREKLLSQEMQHRIKNVFSVVSGLISISEMEAARADAPEMTTRILREKVSALSRASDAAFSPRDVHDAEVGKVEVGALVNAVLQPYDGRYRADGSQAFISRSHMTTIALFLHELATNSVKYGALSAAKGTVTLAWAMADTELNLTWTEIGGPPVAASPQSLGFGSEMVDRIVQSVGGRISKSWPSEGLIAELHLPDSVQAQE